MKNKYCKQVLAVILAATMMAGTVSTATHRVYACLLYTSPSPRDS